MILPRSKHRLFTGGYFTLCLFLLPVSFPSSAQAQGIDLSHGGQITVTALGGFDWNQNTQTVTAYNQAQAVRGNVTVLADQLIAYYRKKQPPAGTPQPQAPAQNTSSKSGGDESGANEIYRLEAIGHVHIFTDTDQAWGDRALYDIDQAVLIMTGKNLKLTTPQDILTARDSMEYYSQTHISIGRGDATVTTNEGKQVRADVLVGYSEPTNTPPSSSPPQANNKNASSSTSTKLKRVNAFGHVFLKTQTETVTGDKGVYIPDTGISRILGNVKITRGQNQLNGAEAIVNMHTGVASMVQTPGSRVQGLVVPNEAGDKPASPSTGSKH